jgi:hypothetical protein
MDSECLRPLEGMRAMGDVLFGRMGSDHGFEHSIPNAIMASKPGQAFWLLTIALAVERLEKSRQDPSKFWPELLTGPILLKDAVEFYMNSSKERVIDFVSNACPELAGELAKSDFGRITILPPPVWYPVNWNNFMQTAFRKRIYKENAVLDLATARQLFPQAYIVTYWSASWK